MHDYLGMHNRMPPESNGIVLTPSLLGPRSHVLTAEYHRLLLPYDLHVPSRSKCVQRLTAYFSDSKGFQRLSVRWVSSPSRFTDPRC